MKAPEMPTVLTIGHSNRTWKDFLELLRAHRVKRVIDVRSIPRSRHNPQFNRATLSKKLRAARIGYVHLRKLGGLRHARRDSPNMGWRNASFRGFADYMQTSDFEVGLHRLLKLAGQKRSAIMCAEAVPWRCHRSLIADALTVRGIRVDDIMSMKRSQVHSLTRFARVQGHRITYPADNRSGGRVPLLRFPESYDRISSHPAIWSLSKASEAGTHSGRSFSPTAFLVQRGIQTTSFAADKTSCAMPSISESVVR
jgi:hypothetical protein